MTPAYHDPAAAGHGAKGPGETPASPPDPWDPVVRVTHWGVAFAVAANGLVTDGGSITHVWLGWAALGLLALRVLWGFVGPAEARFKAFPPDPAGAVAHLAGLVRGRARPFPSHNPAGGLMAYALWAMLALTVATGIAMTGGGPVGVAERQAAFERGDWSVLTEKGVYPDDETGEALEEVHEVAANLLMLLALLHVAGVAVESAVLGRNLVRPMLRGPRQ
jgi:cytochrome b